MTKKKLAYFISSAALLGSASLFPAFAEQLTVSGNGAFSDNSVRVSERSETSVSQSNNTSISNNVSSNSTTGGNSASYNTGGNTTVQTGDAHSDVSIQNTAAVNYANVEGNKENNHDRIEVKRNGAFSDNSVNYSDEDKKHLDQDNSTKIENNVQSKSDTGSNHVEENTWYKQKENKDWESEQKDWSDKKDDKKYESKQEDSKDAWKDDSYKKDESDKKDHEDKQSWKENDDHKYVENNDQKSHDEDKKTEYKSDNKSYDYDKKDWSDKKYEVTYIKYDDHNKYAYLQNCNYYLNFVYKHEGYNGDWDCEKAYEYYMKHKDDHSYSVTTYNDHDKGYVTYTVKKDYNTYGKKENGKYFTQKYQTYYPNYQSRNGGNVSIHTGNATSSVRIANTAGFNYASL